MSTDLLNDPLNDSLDDFYADFGMDAVNDAPAPRKGDLPLSQAVAPMYSEKCASCRGTGRFTGYSGRIVGTCFKCKGTGTIVYKMSPVKRQAARQSYQNRKEAQQAVVRSSIETFKDQHPVEMNWLITHSSNTFAQSLLEQLNKRGALSEKQVAAITNAVARDADREANRAKETAAREAAAPAVTIEAIERSFESARDKGIKRPKLRLDTFKFSLAPESGKNAGSIYVVDRDQDQYLGRVTNGKFFRVRECNDEQEKRIIEVCADPKAAAIAYGKREGSCSCCGKTLTNHASIDLGIGPICAGKYGW
jgi:hypothetical protein